VSSPSAAIDKPVAGRLSALDADLLRADLAVQCHKLEIARLLLQEANPESSAVQAGLGTMALAEGKIREARAHLERAVQLEPRHAPAWFQMALLEQDEGAGSARVGELLERVAGLDGDFAEAHVLLGIRATDAGDLQKALVHLRQAVRVLPRRSYIWNALAYAEQKAGDRFAAIGSARQAIRTATTAEQVRMAETLIEATQAVQ
jgi:tetratricopeptide (TPR) repeat protein